jgi:hypothetical protein
MTTSEIPLTQLDTLRAILVSAHELAGKLAPDPLTERVQRAFRRIPEPDRDTILKVIERDATWCRIVEQTASETGISVRPNPHASLYLHVFSNTEPPSEPLRRDMEVIRFGIETFVRLLPLFFQDGVHAQWSAAARELAGDIDDDLRGHIRRLAAEMLELAGEADGDGNGTGH